MAIRMVLLIALLSLNSCRGSRQSELSAPAYIAYVESEESGLRTNIRSGIWSYDFQYKPAGYVALKELDPSNLNKSAIADRVRKLEKTVWFNITIRVHDKTIDPLKYGAKDLDEYNFRLDYFLNKAAQNFHLTYGSGGEMKQVGYYFENNYSIKPDVVAIVGFSIPDVSPQESLTLEYYDELFNAGILKFMIQAEDFQQLPALST